MKIRLYNKNDFNEITSWWNKANEPSPTEDMLPLDTTFVLESDNKLMLCVSLYLTNAKGVCYLENFVGNPEFKGEQRKEAGKLLLDTVIEYAKLLEYKRIFCFSYRDKLKERYKELGLIPTIGNLQAFVKEIR